MRIKGKIMSIKLFHYQWVAVDNSKEIAQLAVCLTEEIIERTGTPHFDINTELAEELCRTFISQNQYYVIAAFQQDHVIGFGALCESYALYAEGKFAILQEFFVLPDFRSQRVGYELIEEIKKFAIQKKWKRIELCTPPLPEFERTVSFYKENGFERTGGYKMKYVIKNDH